MAAHTTLEGVRARGKVSLSKQEWIKIGLSAALPAILLVLASGKGWSPRTETGRPVVRSSAATPMRPCWELATEATRESKVV